MSGGDWLSETAYEYMSELSPAGLGWEFLRRDPVYRQAFEASRGETPGAPDPAAWGLVAFADPDLSALVQPVFWRPEVDARTVVLTPAPTLGAAHALRFEPDRWPGELHQLQGSDGLHLLLRCGGVEHSLWAPESLDYGHPLALLLLTDRLAPARADAALRFWRCLAAPGSREPARPADPRLTRLRLALRAHDGRRTGASYRELAEGLFGRDRIDPASWKTNSLRDTTIRLVRSGAAFANGEYRTLLSKRSTD